MSNFEVLVRTIDDVRHHPDADRLSLIRVLGYEAISAKNEDGSHRFEAGEPIAYVPEGALVPEPVLRERGFWNEEKDVGMLAGKAGNRVKAIRLRGVISQGLVFKTEQRDGRTHIFMGDEGIAVEVGDDVSEFFGITKYEPPVPVGMNGEVVAATEFAFNYDIENAQNFPGFLEGDLVEATEKLHGTHFRVTYHHTARHADIHEDGSVAIASKGLGQKGLVFKNSDDNAKNLYVRTAVEMDLPVRVKALGERLGKRVDLFGEIFGAGVQDLHYGSKTPTYRAFDIAIDGTFADASTKAELFEELQVERVPVLFQGIWDDEFLIAHRDGKTVLGGENIREGIVVTAMGDQSKRLAPDGKTHLRPILKMVSPDYLTRKGNVTEFN